MKVLLPLDGSECSKHTLEWVTAIFNTDTTNFYLLTVVPHVIPELTTMTYEVEDALKVLETDQAYLEGKGFKVDKAEYMVGDPAQLICQYAEEMNIEQIVIGSHGRSGLSKLLLGSVSSAVFEKCKIPVLVHKNRIAQKANV